MVVLAMLFTVPLFTASTYVEPPVSFDYGLTLISKLGPETLAGQHVFNDTVLIQSEL